MYLLLVAMYVNTCGMPACNNVILHANSSAATTLDPTVLFCEDDETIIVDTGLSSSSYIVSFCDFFLTLCGQDDLDNNMSMNIGMKPLYNGISKCIYTCIYIERSMHIHTFIKCGQLLDSESKT